MIERLGGRARCAPSMRELPRPESPEAFAFAETLLAGGYDMVIFLTGVGARTLMAMIETRHPRARIIEALGKVTRVARGPKPVAALREWRLAPDVLAPEPNTWREVLTALDEAGPLAGRRIAMQEYGESNEVLIAALRERGAEVTPVGVYNWALPEDLGPLQEAIRAAVDGQTDVVTFTSAQQVRHVLQVAAEMELEGAFRTALEGVLIASIGPTCSEALRAAGLGVDFEPDRVKMAHLVRGLARSGEILLGRKRSSREAGVATHAMRRIDAVWPAVSTCRNGDPLHESVFLKACRRERTPYTPVWLMRQAGRYQRAYRDIRAKVSFLELCRTPELAAEVTLMAVDQLGVDAAIIFSDILLILEPMGAELSFRSGGGPHIANPVREAADVDRLREPEPAAMGYVFDAIRLTRRALKPDVPLIGFCGAPYTVASYLIEGGTSRDFRHAKSLMYRDAGAWDALMARITRASVAYLNGQIDAGAQAVQLFDTWAGCLNESDYRRFVLPHVRTLVEQVRPDTPVIYFSADSAALVDALRELGTDVIGVDWRVRLDRVWASLGYDVAVQGNLDPTVLFASPAEIQRRAEAILDQAGGRPGHIFNLGHGILPQTPVDHVLALIDAVHAHGGPAS